MQKPARILLRVLRVFVVVSLCTPSAYGKLRAGAFAEDITPTEFPVIVNGGFVEASSSKVSDALHARALVLDDGVTRIAIVVVDSCMLPRELCDDVKGRASKTTGIPVDRMLISATHTHSAPSAMGCLGSDADEKYVKVLPGLIAAAIEKANSRLAPAKVGWGGVQAPEMTATRRYVHRLDRPRMDPFGEPTVFANMHPGYNNPDAVGPTGPTDPGVSVLSVRHADGKPLAVLANFSMHYVGGRPAVSADYFGLFCDRIAKAIGGDESFVGIMSQGTSGDSWLADYSKPQPKERWNVETFSTAMAEKVTGALKGVEYRDDVPLGMKEGLLKLKRRVPDERRLAWARERVAKLGGAKPKAQADIYAREAIFLHEDPVRELKLQAVRIGDVGMTAIPNEVYALTGLKLKAMSPLPVTFNVSLANGSEGYIPPAEQFGLGGYTTWPARTAALEEGAEGAIVETVLKLLEEVAGGGRKTYAEPVSVYAKAVLGAKPAAFYPMGDLWGPTCVDAGGGGRHGKYERGVVFHLSGVEAGDQSAGRAAHFGGGRMAANLPEGARADRYSVEFWFWNGLSADARAVTAYLFSRGRDGDRSAPGDHLGIGGTHEGGSGKGKLILFNGNARGQLLVGETIIRPKTWHHVALVRDGKKALAYLNGRVEIEGEIDVTHDGRSVFFGGRCDNFANLEGKLDDVAVFDRALSGDEVAAHFKAAGVAPERPQVRRSSEPLSPDESRKRMHLLEGYEAELVAAEPLVVDPVAIEWGPDGKLWVVEMHDYPYGMDGKGKPGGRIKFLEDADGDGRYEKATTFLENVRMPNGMMAWRNGVLVTAAPEIFYSEDTDGDGKADKTEVLFTGFKEGNPQLRINGLRWGLDGWVYCANGWSAGVVTSKKTGQKVDLKGRDLRIRPDTGEMELVSGVSQFGRERDDFGRWFGVDNAHPLFHYIYEDRYLKRNPHLPPPEAKVQLMGQQPRVYPRSVLQRRYIGLDHHGHYTSACGISIERSEKRVAGSVSGAALDVFICEPVHNLIQHQVLFEEGATFVARRAEGEKDRDFLASEDPWFKPVMTRLGPDGALWVVDMYRYIVEHPDWLDEKGKRELAPFYRDGEDRGRVWRVYRKDAPPRRPARLSGMLAGDLAAALASPGAHTRDQAQMMLLWGGDPAAGGAVEKVFSESTDSAVRVQALWTLARLADLKISNLRSEILMAVLRDSHPLVRVNALRVAEGRMDADGELLEAACALVEDRDVRVRAQLAFSLGGVADPRAGDALARLAVARPADRAVAVGVLSSAGEHFAKIAAAVTPGLVAIDSELYRGLIDVALASGDRRSLAKLLNGVCPPDSIDKGNMAEFARFLDILAARKMALKDLAGKDEDDELSVILRRSHEMLGLARYTAAEEDFPPDSRNAAMELLGRDPAKQPEDLRLVERLLSPAVSPDLRTAAVRAAARTGDASVPAVLLKGWGTHSPALRVQIADVLLSRQTWALELARSPAARDLDFARKQRLLNHGNADVKKAAKATLEEAGAAAADRQRVIDEYQASLGGSPDVGRGKQIYMENCATCHRSGGEGNDIGPTLLSVRDWTRENLLAAILDPDRTVEPRYIAYAVTTRDEQTLTGVITNESAAGITIKTLDAKEHQVPRAAIKSLTSTGHSLMPQGFEGALSPQDMADLIGFIQSAENR